MRRRASRAAPAPAATMAATRPVAARRNGARAARQNKVSRSRASRGNEPVTAVYPKAGSNHAPDDRHHAGGRACVPLPARRGTAGSRLPDHPGADLLSRREPGCDDVLGDGAAGSAVRPDAESEPDELGELGRGVGHHTAISLSISLDIAEQEVQAAINAAGNLLPSDLPAPPIYAKV